MELEKKATTEANKYVRKLAKENPCVLCELTGGGWSKVYFPISCKGYKDCKFFKENKGGKA